MKQTKIVCTEGFVFNRNVETKYGVLPMRAAIAFTKIPEHEKARFAEAGIQFNALMVVRTIIRGNNDVCNEYLGFVNIDMNDGNALHAYATDFMNNHKKEFTESVAFNLYMEDDSKFWSLFEDKSMPDMSEYRNEKQR